MVAYYVKRGETVDYRPATDVHAGDVVVLGSRAAIATLDINADELGALSIAGVYSVPKDASVVNLGTALYWNPETRVATTTSSSSTVPLGVAVNTGTPTDTRVLVLIGW